MALKLSSYCVVPTREIRIKWQPIVNVIKIMLSNINVICYDVTWIKQIWCVHHVSPISWIWPILCKIDDFLHVPHINVNVSNPIINSGICVACISKSGLVLTSVYIKLETLSHHRWRISFDCKAIVIWQIWTNQAKTNPSCKVVSLCLTITQIPSIEIWFLALSSFNSLRNIPRFEWQVPIDLLLSEIYIQIPGIGLVQVNRSIISLFSYDMIHHHSCFVIKHFLSRIYIKSWSVWRNLIVIFSNHGNRFWNN